LIPVGGEPRTPTLARGSSNSTLPQGHQHTYDVFMCNRMGRRTPRGRRNSDVHTRNATQDRPPYGGHSKPRHAMMMVLHTFAGNAYAIVSHTTPHTTLIQYHAHTSSGSAPDLPRFRGCTVTVLEPYPTTHHLAVRAPIYCHQELVHASPERHMLTLSWPALIIFGFDPETPPLHGDTPFTCLNQIQQPITLQCGRQ
jgi:hypothetical protein